VWRVQNGRAIRRDIKTGILGDQKIQILSGVEEGDKVILYPPATLKDGQRVRVTGT
jgi:multidrug efflux pump subunit AcrA (membrane-fusion protein)